MEYKVHGQNFTFSPPEWTGRAKLMAEMWKLLKGERTAVCTMWNHPVGAEIRIDVDDEMHRTHASRDLIELLAYTDEWREKFTKKGWTEPLSEQN